MTIEVLRRPWADWATPAAGKSGLLYDVVIIARRSGRFDCRRLLETTASLHKHIAHIMLGRDASSVRITIPACIGAEATINVIERFYAAAINCLSAAIGYSAEGNIKKLCETSPEYVLSPENPLTFLSPDMQCSFFGV